VRVYKSPTCGCCSAWSEHLKENGFEVELVDTNDMPTVKVALGVPYELGSCHTAEVGDYLVEGHVPADDIKALLSEAPSGVRGLAVPNMPIGSPGMETPGMAPESYDVIAFDEQGGRRTRLPKSLMHDARVSYPIGVKAGLAFSALWLAVAAFAPIAVHAQDDEDEALQRWVIKGELTSVLAQGNAETLTLGFGGQVRRRWEKHAVRFEAGSVRALSLIHI